MRIITAPERNWPWGYEKPWVFLAGGITNCPNWQIKAIDKLKKIDHGVLFNPRRDNFPIHDPNAAREQITWEFNALMNCSIFTMWFSAGTSDQPIGMYELGRYLARYQLGRIYKIVIGCENGYKREQDVLLQVGLVDSNLHVFRDFTGYLTAIREAIE